MCACVPSVTEAPCPQVYYPVRHHLVQHMVSAMQRLGFTPSVTIEQRRLAVDLSEVVVKWELQRIKDQQVGCQPSLGGPAVLTVLRGGNQSSQTVCFFKPDSDMDPNSSGEGVNSVSSSIKRGLSVDSAQEVKRFRTATGAISAVRSPGAPSVRPSAGSALPVGHVPSASLERAVPSPVPESWLGSPVAHPLPRHFPPHQTHFPCAACCC